MTPSPAGKVPASGPAWWAPGATLAGGASASTSDLSIDEELALHSVSYEPVDLVYANSIHSVPVGIWNWGAGEISYASDAHLRSFRGAADRLRDECARVGAHGVVGVEVELDVSPHHISVQLTGTAIKPVGASSLAADAVFISDLSGRDFALLTNAGWAPLGLASGASYVYAPRRRAGAAFQQAGQNVELTNFTEAIYAAREAAMERMQAQAQKLNGTGVVGVRVLEGPMGFAQHAVGFSVYGTVVHLVSGEHRNMTPKVALSLDDLKVSFDVRNLS